MEALTAYKAPELSKEPSSVNVSAEHSSAPLRAENKTTLTFPLYARAMNAAGGYYPAAVKGLCAIGALWAALLVFTLITGGAMMMVWFELGLLGLIALWLLLIYPRSRQKKAYKAMLEKSSQSPERYILFFDDRCAVTAGEETVCIPYASIRTIRWTEGLLVLVSEDRTGVIAAENGFIQGTAAEVLRLIEEHREV